jgi:HSP20 family protein
MLQLLDHFTRNWNPWQVFDRLDDDLFRLTPSAFRFGASDRTPVNIYTGDQGAKVVVRLPGWQAEWFDLTVEGDRLLLKGQTPEGEDQATEKSFQRMINLPFRIDPDSVRASYKNGLLLIEAEKHERELPRRIDVAVA